MTNKTPDDWYSRKLLSFGLITYGSEIVAARIDTDKIVEMRFMLRMLDILVEGPSVMFGDNLAAINSASIPEDTLKKRHNALSYHRVREAIVAKVVKFHHISGKEIPADVLTKFLPSSVWWPLMKPILHWTDKDNP